MLEGNTALLTSIIFNLVYDTLNKFFIVRFNASSLVMLTKIQLN
jgi:hypothetical protein